MRFFCDQSFSHSDLFTSRFFLATPLLLIGCGGDLRIDIYLKGLSRSSCIWQTDLDMLKRKRSEVLNSEG